MLQHPDNVPQHHSVVVVDSYIYIIGICICSYICIHLSVYVYTHKQNTYNIYYYIYCRYDRQHTP